MNKMQEQVAEFHKAFGVPVNTTPRVIDRERMLLRAKLIYEESLETILAMNCFIDCHGETLNGVEFYPNTDNSDLAEIADGVADLLYVTFGACLEFGIDAQKVFDEVHRSNITKLWTSREKIHANAVDLALKFERLYNFEGLDKRVWIAKRDDGKIIKSPSYSPANIQSVLDQME